MQATRPGPAKRRACPEPRRRGAPRGNLNALRTGTHSRQLAALVERVLADPDLRRLIELLADRPALRDHRLRRAISVHGARARRREER